jgi:hypothetical protein
MAEQDYRPAIAALRAAGHDAAAATLEAAAKQRPPGPPGPRAPAVVALDTTPADVQRRREGAVVLEGLRAAGIGSGWVGESDMRGGKR